MIKIRLHQDYITYYPIGGEKSLFEEAAVKYMNNLTNWGCPRRKVGDLIEVEFSAGVEMDMTDFLYIETRSGGSVEGFKPALGIKDMSKEVPNYLPNSTKTVQVDGTPTRVLKTWNDWVKPTYTRMVIDGVTWVLSYSGTDGAKPLSSEVIYDLFMFDENVIVEDKRPGISDEI